MSELSLAIEKCFDLRASSSELIGQVLANDALQSELEIAQRIKSVLGSLPNVLPGGWYDPPPGGVAVLLGATNDNFERTRFDTLRNEQYWSSPDHHLTEDVTGILYASPVSATGIIGDWGATFYTGSDEKVRHHIITSLETVELLAEFTEVGMEFGDISRHADQLLETRNLTTDRTVLMNSRGATGTNCGHSIPGTSQPYTVEELDILQSRNQRAINKLISSKRVFVNTNETTTIQNTCAFTVELRLESLDEPTFPNTFFHLIVGFEDGVKTIQSNLNQFFDAVGMDYVRSKF